MLTLRRSRQADEAFSDLLGYGQLVDDGVVQMRTGDLLAGYYLSPPDLAYAAPDVRLGLSGRINAALARLGTGWAVWSDVAVVPRSEYPPGTSAAFPDRISRVVDEERRRHFTTDGTSFQNERVLLLGYAPPPAMVRRMSDAMYRDDAPEARSAMRLALAEVRRTLEAIEDEIGGLLGMRRMGSYLTPDFEGVDRHFDELVSYLAYCATGRPMQIALPREGAFLDAVIGGDEYVPGHRPQLGDERIAVVAIDGFPAQSIPTVLYALSVLPMEYRLTQRFIVRDTHDAEADIKKIRWQWKLAEVPLFLKALGMTNLPVNADAVAMREGCDTALSLARSGRVRFGYYSAAVVLRHRDPAQLEDAARVAVRAIHEAGYHARIEAENAAEAFMGSLPGHVRANIRRPMIHTANLADLMPVSRPWQGPAQHPNPMYQPRPAPPLMLGLTDGAVPIRFTPAVGDVGNFVFFGPPGSGKTSLLNLVAMQALRYPGMRIRGVDYKAGMLTTALAVGGTHRAVGGDDGPSLAPFEHLETERDMRLAQEWAEIAFHLQTQRRPEPRHREAIRGALETLRDQPGLRRVTNLVLAAQDDEVRAALRYYQLGSGPGGTLFDAEGSDRRPTHVDVYDVTAIMGAGDAVLLPALLSIFATFERDQTGDPMMVLIDEAWNALSHPAWAPKLRSDLKTKRSFNVSIGLATQNLSDVARSSLADVLLENVPTRLYGANSAAQLGGSGDEAGPADLYRGFGLTWEQREAIRQATPKRHYALSQGDAFRVVDFCLGPLALAIAAETSEAAVREVRRLVAAHGPDWITHHLRAKGLPHANLA